jgi:hypothetical protein
MKANERTKWTSGRSFLPKNVRYDKPGENKLNVTQLLCARAFLFLFFFQILAVARLAMKLQISAIDGVAKNVFFIYIFLSFSSKM